MNDMALVRALEESQAERDTLKAEVERLRKEVEMFESWYPVDVQGERVYVCLHGEEGDHWLAVFSDKRDADAWAEAQGKTPDPDDARKVFVHEGEAAGIRCWNDVLADCPPVISAAKTDLARN